MQRTFQKGFKILQIPFFILFFLGIAVAQNGENPFELVPRAGTKVAVTPTQPTVTETESIEPEVTSEEEDDNPFALVPAFKGEVKPRKKTTQLAEADEVIENPAPIPPSSSKEPVFKVRRFIFSIVILDLILVAIVLTLLRNYFQKTISSFINDNLLAQVFRERQSGVLIPFLIFYFLFFLNLALFFFLLMGYYEVSLKQGALTTFLYIFLGVCLAFLGKHLLLRMVGYIFPIDKELRKYSFTIMIFGIITGFLLLLVNLLLAYGPEGMTKYVVFISFGMIILIYLFRSLRGVFIANKYFWFHKFHFLLYICTVEIAPVLIMIKLILKST